MKDEEKLDPDSVKEETLLTQDQIKNIWSTNFDVNPQILAHIFEVKEELSVPVQTQKRLADFIFNLEEM